MPTKTILIFPFDLMSHYLRCIRLAAEYKDHSILFASSEKYNSYVLEAGYKVFNVEGFDPELVMACSRKFDFSWLNKKDIERVFLSQIEAINHYKPNFVIGDTSPTLKMAAEKTGVKYVTIMNGYMTKYYAETRALSRTHPAYEQLKKLPPNVGKKIINIAEHISFRIVHKPFKQVRRTYRLKRVNTYLSEMEGDENLICDSENLFPQRQLPGNYRIIGPLIYEPTLNEEDLTKELSNKKHSICVCMGSSGDWEKLSFLSKPDYQHLNIVTAGDHHHYIKGDHVITKSFVNLDQVLPKCSLLICHGGNGTLYKGIQHNVFMLCLTSHFEQEWNVQMLERLNFGRSINDDPELITNTYINHHINHQLTA